MSGRDSMNGSRPMSRARSLPPTPGGSSMRNASRPPWQPPNAGPNTIHGGDIPPVLDGGALARHKQNQGLEKDKYLLQSLRVADDPNVEWRNEQMRAKIYKEGPDAPMPSIFEKLTNPQYYTGSHKHRFRKTDGGAWQGSGLQGRRDDTEHNLVVAGKGQIVRNIDPEMDQPIRVEKGAVMPWELDRLRPDAYHTVDMKRVYKSTEAFEDPVMDPDKGVYGKLAREQVRANRKTTDPGEYEASQAARRSYHVNPDQVMSFQVGV